MSEGVETTGIHPPDDVTEEPFISDVTRGYYGNHAGNKWDPDILRVEWLITLGFYYRLFVLVFGTVGNFLAVFVVRLTKMRKTTKIIIAVLAAVDTTFLVLEASNDIYKKIHHNTLYNTNTILCKICFFNYLYIGTMSNILVAVLTVERCIAVTVPLKAKIVWTTKTVAVLLIALFAILLAFNSYILHYYTFSDYFDGKGAFELIICHAPHHINSLMINLNPFYEAIIPVTLVVACNCVICFTLVRSKIQLGSVNQENQLSPSEKQLIVTTFALSVAYLILCVPTNIYFNLGERILGSEIFANYENTYAVVTDMLQYTNFGINFYLYVAFTRAFREQLKQLIRRCRLP